MQECKESVAQLVDDDYQHVVVVDEVGVGHDGSYKLCIDAFDEGRAEGRYIWFLDDDDRLADPEFIGKLKQVAEENGGDPPVIVVRHMNAQRIWPEDQYWGKAPVRRHIGNGCMIYRRDVWRKYADHLMDHPYAGDIYMIMACWGDDVPWVWLDLIGTLKSGANNALSDAELDRRGLLWEDPRQFHEDNE